MLRLLWNMTGFLAIVNLLAIVFFVGWLYVSGRLDVDRVNAVRELLRPTVAEVEYERRAAEAAAEQQAKEELDRVRDENPLPPSEEQIHYIHRINQRDRDRTRRAADEAESLRRQLEAAQQALAAERDGFAAERAQWQNQIGEGAQAAEATQFQRVVTLLEQIPPKQAKDILISLMQAGDDNQAVAYLNAMKPFNAAEVVKSFKGDEQQLATELLQRMKSLGSDNLVAEGSSDAADSDPTG